MLSLMASYLPLIPLEPYLTEYINTPVLGLRILSVAWSTPFVATISGRITLALSSNTNLPSSSV